MALKQPGCACTVSTQHETSILTEKKRALLVDGQVTEAMVKEHPPGRGCLRPEPPIPYCYIAWSSEGSTLEGWQWCLSAGCGCSAWDLALLGPQDAVSGCLEVAQHQDGFSGCVLCACWHSCTPAGQRFEIKMVQSWCLHRKQLPVILIWKVCMLI